MAKFIFVTGGRKSGKSSYALKRAEELGSNKIFLATAAPLDDEMKKRIRAHKMERDGSWETVEETIRIGSVIENRSDADVILIDCLTLWLTNLIFEKNMDDSKISEEIENLAAVIKKSKTNIIAVSNELGFGIVPLEPVTRRFLDLAGELNQKMASAAESVILSVSGIPVLIKGT